MRSITLMLAVTFGLISGAAVAAQQSTAPKAKKSTLTNAAKITQALSAAPADIAKNATVMDWPDTPTGPMKELRKGTNGWMCMPSSPSEFGATATQDPMCLDKQFSGWADARMHKTDPHITSVGVAYMLRGDRGASNTDPFATAPTANNQWILSPPHIMVALPNTAALEGIPTDPHNGGPWVMWKGTKYAHIMVPVSALPKGRAGEVSCSVTRP